MPKLTPDERFKLRTQADEASRRTLADIAREHSVRRPAHPVHLHQIAFGKRSVDSFKSPQPFAKASRISSKERHVAAREVKQKNAMLRAARLGTATGAALRDKIMNALRLNGSVV